MRQRGLENPIMASDFYINGEIAQIAVDDYPGLTDGYGDAFRHAYWMALNSEMHGKDSALEFGLLHETSHVNSSASFNMDMNNNTWGATWGASDLNNAFNFSSFYHAFNSSISTGEISIINEDSIPEEFDDYDPEDDGSGGDYTEY